MNEDKRIKKLEEDVERVTKLLRKVNQRYRDINHAKTHYLKHRAPGVLKRQGKLVRSMKVLAKKLECIPRFSLQVTHKAKSHGRQNVLFMCTSNQARKLRALADADLRPILNASANAGGKRVRLGYTPPPRSVYARKMEKKNKEYQSNNLSSSIRYRLQNKQ